MRQSGDGGCRRAPGPDARRDADPVDPAARHREAPGGGDEGPDLGDAPDVADGVLRQGPAPAGHVGGGDVGRAVEAVDGEQGREVVTGERDEVIVGALQDGLLASTPVGDPDELAPGRPLGEPRPLAAAERHGLRRDPGGGRLSRRDEQPGALRDRRAQREGDDGDRDHGDVVQHRGHGGQHPREQPTCGVQRQGDDHGVGDHPLPRALGTAGRRGDADRPARALPAKVVGEDPGAHGGPARPQPLDRPVDEQGHAAAQPLEHRGARGGRGPGRGDDVGERLAPPPGLPQRRDRRAQRQLVGPPGVHPAEQRLDEDVEHGGPAWSRTASATLTSAAVRAVRRRPPRAPRDGGTRGGHLVGPQDRRRGRPGRRGPP